MLPRLRRPESPRCSQKCVDLRPDAVHLRNDYLDLRPHLRVFQVKSVGIFRQQPAELVVPFHHGTQLRWHPPVGCHLEPPEFFQPKILVPRQRPLDLGLLAPRLRAQAAARGLSSSSSLPSTLPTSAGSADFLSATPAPRVRLMPAPRRTGRVCQRQHLRNGRGHNWQRARGRSFGPDPTVLLVAGREPVRSGPSKVPCPVPPAIFDPFASRFLRLRPFS